MSSPSRGVIRRLAFAIGGLSFAAALIAPAAGHEGHDHGAPPPVAAMTSAPRIAVQSEAYELVGVLKAKQLTLYLDRFATNEPVTDAKITATLGDQEVAAEMRQDGVYVVSSTQLAGHGPLDVVFSITAPGGDDLLVGTLNLPAEPAASVSAPATTLEGLRRRVQALQAGPGPSYALAGSTLALGVLIGLGLRAGSRWAPAAGVVVIALLASAGYALAHEGHDHGQEPAVATSDSPQRLPDGSVYLPKPSQRLLEVRTTVAQPRMAHRAVSLVGRVIADPNRSGLVQSINGGRVGAAAGGLPRLGQAVRKGDIVATVERAIIQADQATLAERVGDIEQQAALAEARLARARRLVESGAGARISVSDSEIELDGLKRRLAAVRQVQVAPEVLRAPVDGTISAVKVVAGQVVGAQDVLFQIVDPAGLWVEALVFGDLDPAKLTGASAAAADGGSLTLAFVGFGRALQQQATVVQFAIVDPPIGVSVGQPLTVVARNGAEVSAVIMPRDAVVRSGNGDALVWLHMAPERFEGRPVRVEPFDAAHVIVRDGLNAGERVVVRGAELINQVR